MKIGKIGKIDKIDKIGKIKKETFVRGRRITIEDRSFMK